MKSTTIKIISLLLTACVFLGVTSCSLFSDSDEEETTEATTIASATPLMTEPTEVLAYFNALMAGIKTGTAKLTYSSDYNPGSFECENEVLKASLPTIVKLMRDGFNADLGAEVEYGQSIADIIPVKNTDGPLVLTADDIVDIAINAEAFSRYNDELSKAESDTAYTTEVVELDEDVRKITITLKDELDPKAGEGLFGKIYNIPDRAKISEEMSKLSDYITYDGNYTAKYTGCTIYMEINRTTNEVIKVEFNRNIEVDVEITGVGNLASVGTTNLHFVVGGTDRYEFDWTDPATVTTAAE